jgi:HK97 family phage major capsid protein
MPGKKKRHKKGSKSKPQPEDAQKKSLGEDEDLDDLDGDEGADDDGDVSLSAGDDDGGDDDQGNEDFIDVDEDYLKDLVGKAFDEKLAPITSELKTLQKITKRFKPRLIAGLGNPTKSLDGGDEEEDLNKTAISKGMEAWNKRRNLVEAAMRDGEYSLGRAIQSIIDKDKGIAPFEWEVSDAIRRTLEFTAGSGGGLLVADEFLGNEFLELLYSWNVTRQAGIRIMSGLAGGTVRLPGLSAGMEVVWSSQGTDITEDDVTPQQKTMSPKIAVVRTHLSRLQNYLEAGVQGILRDDMAEAMANAWDIAVLRGTGTNGQPTGIANTSGINSYPVSTGSGALIDIDDLYAMQLMLWEDKVRGPFAWIMSPREYTTFLKSKDDNGNYLVVPDPTQASRGFLLGHPIYVTHNCRTDLGDTGENAQGELFLIRPSEIVFGEWGTMRIEATTEGSDVFEKDEIALKIVSWCDVVVRHAVAACYCNDATAV